MSEVLYPLRYAAWRNCNYPNIKKFSTITCPENLKFQAPKNETDSANSVDPYEVAHYEPPHKGLLCLSSMI